MDDHHPGCEPRECRPDCAATCPMHTGWTLADLLERFQQEARPGEFSTGCGPCRYYSWGEGPPLVLIPGLAGDCRLFIPMMALLSRRFRCLSHDLPPGATHHAELLEVLWALLDHLGLERAYVFGSDLGGAVALAALHARPRVLPRGIVQAGFLRARPTLGQRLACRLMSRWPLAWFPGRQRRLARLHRQPFLARPAEVWEHFRRCTLPVRAAGQLTRLLHQVDLTPVAMQIRQPVLLVCGDRDRVVPAADSEALLRALPSGGRVIIEGSGHIPTLTHPEALAGVVRAFLTPPEPGCPARQNLEVVRE